MNYNAKETKVDTLNQNIDRIEISLNSLTEELRKLKEKKQELEKTKNKTENSISRSFETKKVVVLEHENSTESTSKKKKKSEKKSAKNVHETVEIQEPLAYNNFRETKDKRSRSISISEASTEDIKTTLKKKKRKKENKANEDVNIESTSMCGYETPNKKKKGDRNISTNLDTPSTYEESLLENKESRKSKQKNQTNKEEEMSDKMMELEKMNEMESKVDIHSSLDQNIDHLETSLYSLLEELRKLKEHKQALENMKNKPTNSISNNLETNNKRKQVLVLEYENSAESPTTYNDHYFKEAESNKSRTISASKEVSNENVETITSKKKKQKKKNKANEDVNENNSIGEDETPRKIKKKKDKNIATNYDISSTQENIVKCTENSLEDQEARKLKEKKKMKNIDKNESKVNMNFSLDKSIDYLETSLNTLTENLRKLKEKKQALENTRNKTLNSICGNLETNSKRKEILIVEYENSAESKSEEKTKSEKKSIQNGHEILENEEPSSYDNYFKETKDKRSRTISASEASVADVEITTSKKNKRKKKNKANEDVNIESPDINESISTYEDQTPRKKSKKETPSTHENTVVCTENALEKKETSKPKQINNEDKLSNKITELEKMNLKDRLEIIKKLVNSFTEQIEQNNENNKHSEPPLNTTAENLNNQIENNPIQNYSPQNFRSNYVPHNNKFNNNNLSDQNNRFEYNNSPKKSQNGQYFNNTYQKQTYRKDKINLRDELKFSTVKLDFNGANISDILGYGERVNKY